MDNRDQGKECVMNDGRPRAPQASIPVSILTRFFILIISQYAKTALAAANAAGFAPPKQLK